MKTRAATKYRIQVLPSKDGKQWYIRFCRSGRVVLAGETRKGRVATLTTARNIAKAIQEGNFVIEDLTKQEDELPNDIWSF